MYYLELTPDEFELVKALAESATVRGKDQVRRLHSFYHKLDAAERAVFPQPEEEVIEDEES